MITITITIEALADAVAGVTIQMDGKDGTTLEYMAAWKVKLALETMNKSNDAIYTNQETHGGEVKKLKDYIKDSLALYPTPEERKHD